MNKSRDQDRKLLTKLTLESDASIKKCENVQKKAAEILKVNIFLFSRFLVYEDLYMHFKIVHSQFQCNIYENTRCAEFKNL